jgi:hypothetical protein
MRRLFARILLCAAPLALAGCSLGSIEIEIEPDLSGRLELVRLELPEATPAAVSKSLHGVRSGKEELLAVKRSTYRFDNLDELALGEIRFEVSDAGDAKESGESRLKFAIPLSPEAEWFRLLEIDDRKVDTVMKLLRDNRAQASPILGLMGLEFLNVELKVKLPGPIRSRKVSGVGERAVSWLRRKGPGEVEPNELYLKIPLEAIRQGGAEVAVVEVDFVDEKWADRKEDAYSARLSAAFELYEAKKYEEVVAKLVQLRADFPERCVLDYRLACAHALMGKDEAALEALRSTVKKGCDDVLTMREDPDLKNLRAGSAYRAIEKAARDHFLGSIHYHVQAPPGDGPGKKYGLLIQMGGAGSDGKDMVPLWASLKDRPIFQDLVVITCGYLSDDAEGIFREGALPANAFTLLYDMARERWPIDTSRVVIGGCSASGHSAFTFAIGQPRAFPRVLLIEGPSGKKREAEVLKEAKAAGFRAAVVCGDAPGVFRRAIDMDVEGFKKAGIEHRRFSFPQDRPHELDHPKIGPAIEESLRWLLEPPPRS